MLTNNCKVSLIIGTVHLGGPTAMILKLDPPEMAFPAIKETCFASFILLSKPFMKTIVFKIISHLYDKKKLLGYIRHETTGDCLPY